MSAITVEGAAKHIAALMGLTVTAKKGQPADLKVVGAVWLLVSGLGVAAPACAALGGAACPLAAGGAGSCAAASRAGAAKSAMSAPHSQGLRAPSRCGFLSIVARICRFPVG